jgi:hemolysin activation/secretion protein
VTHQNLTGRGDVLAGSLKYTEGLQDFDISYSLPVTARDTTVKLNIRKSTTVVIEEPFENLDIKSESFTYGLSISHPVYKSPERTITLGIVGEVRSSETSLLGRKFSFSPGVEDGEADITVIRLFQEWLDRNQSQVIAVRSTFSFGIDALGATITSAVPDGEFITWLGQFQWVRRLGNADRQVLVRADVQLANDSLLPIEKFSVGGHNSVRGFRKNRLVRDNGLAASIEFRFPIIRNKKGEGIVQVAPFIDYGRSWNTESPTPDPKDISSVGVGFRWAVTRNINLQIYGGIPFRDFDDTDEDLQDKGVHVRLTASLF